MKNKIINNSPNKEKQNEAVNIGEYEIKKSLFGKDIVRKVKNENRNIGIEYTS